MSSKLPLKLDDLLRQRTVEGDRIEYKAGWNPDATLKTLCSFANDFENLGGGYVIIGQDCDKDGQPIFPPVGLKANQLDRIQRELLGYCNLIQPPYFPILSSEEYEGKHLLVLWAPGGQTRPYEVPRSVVAKAKEYHYYIRRYSSTVEAKGEDKRELLRLTATVPFDDRPCRAADVDDLRPGLIRSFLKEVGSDLYQDAAKRPLVELGRQMNIVDGADEFVKPRNVGLMFFHEAPEKFFPGSQIEVVEFPEGVAGTKIEERIFRGPLHQQLRDALRHLRNSVIQERITKLPDRAEADRVFNYPFSAIEETLVNAVYHRGYDQREPIEVRIHPDRIEIASYPGPDPSIRMASLRDRQFVSRRYRNRRIGEFLKELEMTEGRSTGIPIIHDAMDKNGSPPPRFETDEARAYFLVELPIHPLFAATEAHDKAPVEAPVEVPVTFTDTERQILRVCLDRPLSRQEILRALGYQSLSGHVKKALQRLTELKLLAYTIPGKPNSRSQKRSLTEKGREIVTRGM